MRRAAIAAAALLCLAASPAHARTVTIPTAAGISVTVAADGFAERIAGFIGDLVGRGIRPSQIHCLNFARTHVRHSLHYSGHACDFNGSANRFAPMNGHRVSDLARKWGLRDGCDFHDCGHIDAGLGRLLSEGQGNVHGSIRRARGHVRNHRLARHARPRAHRRRA